MLHFQVGGANVILGDSKGLRQKKQILHPFPKEMEINGPYTWFEIGRFYYNCMREIHVLSLFEQTYLTDMESRDILIYCLKLRFTKWQGFRFRKK